MDPLIQSLSKLWKGFDSLSSGRQISIVTVLLMSAAVIGIMIYMSFQVDYRVLYSNLSAEDAGSIVGKLNEQKIRYKVSATGNSISVPADQVSGLRMEMAAAGLPQGGGVGYEIFDSKTLGATEFEQQLNYRRALQGELSRTINGLDEIQSSRVHIALPRDTLFTDLQKKPTASVTLRLRSGKSLRPQQIDGIVHLVASSIEGMNPADVMIVDTRGNILSAPKEDGRMPRMTAQQVDFQRNMEKEMAGRIQSMLEKVVGPGKAAVRVAADLDFRVTEQTSESYDPEAQVIRSQQRNIDTEFATGDNATVSADPKRERVDEIINYEINRVVSKTVLPVGETKKLSIAVLVDGKYTRNERNEEVYQPLEPAEILALEDLVRKSSGFDANRGDQVVVTNMPFRKADEEEIETAGLQGAVDTAGPILKYLGIFALVGFIVLFVLRPMLKSVMSAAPARPLAEARAGTGAGAAEYARQAADDLRAAAQRPMTETDVTREMARADAKQFADILRNWIK